MKKIISMTDFVLHENVIFKEKRMFKNLVLNYANFLKQPLELWMFVPCNEDGNVLEVNEYLKFNGKYSDLEIILKKHEKANKRCLFEGFEYDSFGFAYLKEIKAIGFNKEYIDNKIIEDIVKYNIQLTQTAIKQIGL